MKSSTIALLCLLLFVGAAASNAVMDVLSFRYERSILGRHESLRGWWDPSLSWKNKWADGDPKNGEAFPLSSTTLVAATDAWHFFKAIMISCMTVAIILPFTRVFSASKLAWIGIFVGMNVLRGIVFEGLFGHTLIR